jgi:hypothetical protein
VEGDLMLQEDNSYLSLALLPLDQSVEIMPSSRSANASGKAAAAHAV